MSTLTLMRHAKSSWPPGVLDDRRPLSDRGRRDAPVAGKELSSLGPPDVALVSPALRTRETWELMASHLPDTTLCVDPRIYAADVTELLSVVRERANDAANVLLLGHNPGIEDLALMLAEQSPGADRDAMAVKYPTSAISSFRVTGPWPQLGADGVTAELLSFLIPRG